MTVIVVPYSSFRTTVAPPLMVSPDGSSLSNWTVKVPDFGLDKTRVAPRTGA